MDGTGKNKTGYQKIRFCGKQILGEGEPSTPPDGPLLKGELALGPFKNSSPQLQWNSSPEMTSD